MNDIVDLDVLVPPDSTIKFGGQDITVRAPKTGDILKLGALGQKLQDIENLDTDSLDSLVVELTTCVQRCIPELDGADLNTQQLLKLVEMLSKMAIPPDVTELEKKGITVGDSDPKAL